jgi:amino acid transporter
MAVAATTGTPEQTVAPGAEWEEADRHLKKGLSFTSLLFLSMGGIIGSGWLFAVLSAAGIAGPGAILSWVVGGIFVILIAMSWAELSGMLPRSGAIVRYPQLTHGAFTGWMVGWSYWLSAVSVPAIEAEAVVTYVGGKFPNSGLITSTVIASSGNAILAWPKGILFGLGLMLLFFVLNFFGIRLLGETNRYVTWWKIVIPTLTFLFLFAAFHGQNFASLTYKGQGGFLPYGASPIFLAISISGVTFSYLGFRQALDFGGEARNPQRDIPLATILSVVIATVLYTILQVVFIGAVNWHAGGAAPGDWTGLAGGPWAAGPFYNALSAAGIGALGAFATVLLFDAGISPSGTGWVYLGAGTRTNYGLSIGGFLPKALQWPNRYGIPWVALLAALVTGCIFFIPAPSWYELVGFVTLATVTTYVMGGLGVVTMRKTAPTLRRPYVLPNHRFWAPVGFLAAAIIVYWGSFPVLVNLLAAIFVALPVFAWLYARNKGWVSSAGAGVLGLIFLAAWVYINRMGGWVLAHPPAQIAGTWNFPLYDIAFSLAVFFFVGGLWALSNAEGRKHIERGFWFIFMLLAYFPLSYYGQFGGQAKPSITFPWDTLIAVVIGLIAYFWGVASGFETQELKEIVAQSGRPGPPSPTTPARPAVLPNAPAGPGTAAI